MKGSGGKKKNQVSNDAVEAASNAAESKKRGDGGAENSGGDVLPLLLRDVVDDGGSGERGEDDEEEEGEEEGDGEGDDREEDDEDEGQEERPKLDEGFFEIEAIRRKRVRKGQHQYLIKWRGWPETANTWEPSENLQSCSDVIDAFEESLRSGKHGRKRKRKSGGFNFQTKKKQPRLTSASHSVSEGNTSDFVKPSSSGLLNNSSVPEIHASVHLKDSNRKGESNGDVNSVIITNQVNENGGRTALMQVDEKKMENEYDPKLSELRGTVSHNEVNANKLTTCSREDKGVEDDDLSNGLPKVISKDSVQSSRCTGAKRRKSGSVKRFKQDANSRNPQSSMQDLTLDSFGTIARLETEYPGVTEDGSGQKHKTEELDIMKILKPISFSASVSDSVQDVLVTFMALRSDGKEVMVDNRFLKAHNPLLLIDFYEQHLKYNLDSS